MDFVKMHGQGNDFVLLDRFSLQLEEEYGSLAQWLCDRHKGVGGDGLLVLLPSDKADVQMRIFNSDGSEPEMCGNGIRCLARFAYDAGYVPGPSFGIDTLAGIKYITLEAKEDGEPDIQVDMGEPILRPDQIPVKTPRAEAIGETLTVRGQNGQDVEVTFTAVSMGNPHCVIFSPLLDEAYVNTLGPVIETAPIFPKRTNVEFVRMDSRTEMTMRVWERGAGPTLACGTGACASVVAAVLEGRADRKVVVHLAGGDLLIDWNENNRVYMKGSATYVFRGTIIDKDLGTGSLE